MYTNYWQLREKPFENLPDPRFVFWSKQHDEALARMLYVAQEKKGAILITGEYGSGKTLLTRVLLKQLENEKYQEALLLNPTLSPSLLIKEVIHQLGGLVAISATKAAAYNRLNELLVEINSQGKLAVIIVDEAQAIPKIANFEEFRLMLNFQLNDSFLLTLILIGQPELKEKIRQLPQLEQRFALRYHLKALTEAETRDYVLHRLKVAGAVTEIFNEEAFGEIYAYSQGIPRKINNLCDLALLVGSAERVATINAELMRKIAADLRGEDDETEGVPVEGAA